MKAKRQKVYSFTDELYKSALVIVVGGDRNKYLKEQVKVTDEYLAPSREWMCEGIYFRIRAKDNKPGSNCSVIWIRTAALAPLVHELVHFCHNVLAEVDIPVTPQSDEAFAYLLEMWTRIISKKMRLKV